MSQSSFIAAVLLAGFVLFVAARGRLKAYADVLFGPAPPLGPFSGIPLLSGAPAKSGGGGGGGGPGIAAPASAKGVDVTQAANENAANSNWIGEAAQAGEAAAAGIDWGAVAADAALAIGL